MQCRHPITNEWCELTNREWRCIKVGIPTTSTLWELSCAEQNYKLLITVVAERQFDDATMQWLIAQLIAHPVNVLTSPAMLHAWYLHMMHFHDIATIATQLAQRQTLLAKLAKLQASKKAATIRMAKQIQRQITAMKDARLRKIRARNKRR